MDDSVWAVLFFFLVALPAFVVWLATILDVISQPFMGVWRKVAWVVGLFIFPIFGVLLYLIVKMSRQRELSVLMGPDAQRGDETGYAAR